MQLDVYFNSEISLSCRDHSVTSRSMLWKAIRWTAISWSWGRSVPGCWSLCTTLVVTAWSCQSLPYQTCCHLWTLHTVQSEFWSRGWHSYQLPYISRSSWISSRALGRLSSLLDVMKVEKSGLALLSQSEDSSGTTAADVGSNDQITVS